MTRKTKGQRKTRAGKPLAIEFTEIGIELEVDGLAPVVWLTVQGEDRKKLMFTFNREGTDIFARWLTEASAYLKARKK